MCAEGPGSQTDFLDGHTKLNEFQLKELRKQVAEKLKKIEKEAQPPPPSSTLRQGRPKPVPTI